MSTKDTNKESEGAASTPASIPSLNKNIVVYTTDTEEMCGSIINIAQRDFAPCFLPLGGARFSISNYRNEKTITDHSLLLIPRTQLARAAFESFSSLDTCRSLLFFLNGPLPPPLPPKLLS